MKTKTLCKNIIYPPQILFIVLICILLSAACTPKTQEEYLNEMPPAPYTDSSPRFSSFDLFTPNTDAAKTFYSVLFGWTFESTSENDQVSIIHKHHRIGSIITTEDSEVETDNARWISNLAIPKFKAAISRIKELGATITAGPEHDTLRGTIALVEDPEGAEFLLSQSENIYQKSKNTVEGEFVWIDLFSKDKESSADFYKNIAGFDIIVEPGSSEHFYFVYNQNIRAGVVVYSWEDVSPNWLPYVGVKDLAESIIRTYEAGGTLLVKSGKSAVIKDPAGAAIGLFEIGDGGQQ